MRNRIISVIGLFLICVSCSKISWVYYYNADYNLRMKYPTDWTLNKDFPSSLAFFISPKDNETDDFLENVSIVVQDITDNPKNLEEYTDVYLKHLNFILKRMKITESRKDKLSKTSAYRIVYELEGSQGISIFTQVWTIRDNKVFIITGASTVNQYESFKKIFEAMLKSFMFIKG